jgi:hypothetical protein
MKTRLILLTLACLLVAVSATAQVNYAVSGSTAFVDRSPNAGGDIVIASTYLGFPVAYIGNHAFEDCTRMASVTIPDSVGSIGIRAFTGCTGLTNVALGNGVTNIASQAFQYCTSLTRAAIPDSVTSLEDRAFQNCYRLADAVIGNRVTGIGQLAFQNCSLSSVTIPDSVTILDHLAFSGCTGLTNVILGRSVASIGQWAFGNCAGLTSVTLPDSVTNIWNQAFSGCAGLTSVAIPHRVTSIGPQTFSSCTSLTNISVAAANLAYSSVDGVLFNKAQTVLITHPVARAGSFVIPGSVTSIGHWAFYQCTNLTGVTLPGGVTNIGPYAFSGCRSLTRVTIPSGVTVIWYFTFAGCSSLTNVTFLGNAPRLVYEIEIGGGGWFSGVGAGAKAYHYCGTTGWGATYGGLGTVMLLAPRIAPGSAGVKPGDFGFTLTCLADQTVVEASANLVNWQPIWTNTLSDASADFVDPEWLHHPIRFYRARSD